MEARNGRKRPRPGVAPGALIAALLLSCAVPTRSYTAIQPRMATKTPSAAVRRLQYANDASEVIDAAFGGLKAGALKNSHLTQALLRAARQLAPTAREDARVALRGSVATLGVVEAALNGAASMRALSEALEACALLGLVPSDALLSHTLERIDSLSAEADPSDATSVMWALERLGAAEGAPALQKSVSKLGLPFSAHTKLAPTGLLPALMEEVVFRQDEIALNGGEKVVAEARLTAWQSCSGVPFSYSGKTMAPAQMTPTVTSLREALQKRLGLSFDGVLINLYPDGKAGMRYHADPDVGPTWTDETVVVSAGDPRIFVLRKSENHAERHVFCVSDGDAVRMFGRCQQEWQHCVKVEREAAAAGPRVSLVFKQSVLHAAAAWRSSLAKAN